MSYIILSIIALVSSGIAWFTFKFKKLEKKEFEINKQELENDLKKTADTINRMSLIDLVNRNNRRDK